MAFLLLAIGFVGGVAVSLLGYAFARWMIRQLRDPAPEAWVAGYPGQDRRSAPSSRGYSPGLALAEMATSVSLPASAWEVSPAGSSFGAGSERGRPSAQRRSDLFRAYPPHWPGELPQPYHFPYGPTDPFTSDAGGPHGR